MDENQIYLGEDKYHLRSFKKIAKVWNKYHPEDPISHDTARREYQLFLQKIEQGDRDTAMAYIGWVPKEPAIYFVATRHPEFGDYQYPQGSVVIDPWGITKDQEGVEVVRLGRPSLLKVV